jgi:hypothetical protein
MRGLRTLGLAGVLVAAVGVSALAEECEAAGGSLEWSASDKQELLDACLQVTSNPNFCECLLDAAQAHCSSLRDFLSDEGEAAGMAQDGKRCEALFGK